VTPGEARDTSQIGAGGGSARGGRIGSEFEAIDPNALHLGGFAWDGRLDVRPVPLEPVVAEA
jgi:hypothetical protein